MKHSGATQRGQAPRLDGLAESELGRSGFRLAFPDALERRYREDIGAERLREIRTIVWWGVTSYFCLGILLNLTVIPNPDWKNVAIQLGGACSAVLLILRFGLGSRNTVATRENALLVCCLLCSAAAMLVITAKPTPATLRDFLMAIPPASFVLVFVRLRFAQTLGFFVVNLGVFALVLVSRPEISSGDDVFLIGFMMTLLLPSLVGAHAYERASRRIYLHRLLDRLRSEALEAQNATLTDLSYTDALTGVANRRRLDEALAELVAAPGVAGALLLIDIDRFKAFNDRYGHLAGDTCLCHVAKRLAAHLRSADLLARFGGEEFAVLLPQATMDDAAQTAERLRDAVQHLQFVVERKPVSVTISVGVALRDGAGTPQALIGAADVALYAAKHAGRNRVRIAAPGHDHERALSA
ncbi:GGDEF domain-containing protein [Pandoraea sp.]|uniref:GGDEF domain-containing protein n=1 Tax=Pandoraea sp. TaxID=1883445 RepID=UPI0011F47B30|nr:GGDEF domain-containing protein [Pandoraea sp.]TAL52824.1 MAG: GGDEF domain-containing protein [Pandoraea sp.]TAM19731.1 MAG: GGDEF domain-containing protein [Pandoraea sp.]